MKNIEYSVVIPAFNEEARILPTLEKISDYFRHKNCSFEIIVVDDGSIDKTEKITTDFSGKNNETKCCSYSPNRGKGYAVKYGIEQSNGAYILISDADLSSPIEESEKLIFFINKGYDIAVGSRGLKESNIVQFQPFYRRTMGKIFNKFVKLLIIGGINDTQCGFKVFTSDAASKIFSQCRIEGFSFDVEILFIAKKVFNMKIKEVPVTWINSPASRVQPLRHSYHMLRELISIRNNYLRGFYKRSQS